MKAPRRVLASGLSVLALSCTMLVLGSAAPANSAPFTAKLQTHHSNKCLDVATANTANGAFVQQWMCYTTANQVWDFTWMGDGYYTLSAQHSGKCLDVETAGVADGARVQQWQCNNTANQHWRLAQRPSGRFALVARHSGKCLEVSGGSIHDGAGVVQQTCDVQRPYQEWRLI